MIPFLDILSPIIGKILDKIPDAGAREKARLEFELQMAQQEQKLIDSLSAIDSKQLEVNAEEAKNSSLFVSGWRPGVAWVCVAAFTWAYVLQPVVTFTAAAVGHPIAYLPSLNMGDMMPVLLGLLGLGTLRTIEKKNGTQGTH
jgi:Holin of 3TMs, for gene-transfer release